ncbi:MAG: FAD-binding protein [Gemmataceae bacterium]|nr:FAD-binding protein [Gemmataceae bacterium]
MDEQQGSRIHDDLQGFFRGDLLFDDVTRMLYSTDASIFQVKPMGVAAPQDEDDLRALVRYAGEHRIPLVPRGAGTGMAGEALGSGLVVDLSRRFRAILDVGADTVHVQAGVTLHALNQRLAQERRRFAPDPSSGVCTLGGMLATNASGAHALKHGYTSAHVVALRAMLDNGDPADVRPLPWPLPPDFPIGHYHDLLTALGVLFEQNHDVLEQSKPRLVHDRCGYRLHGILRDQTLNVPRLLVGSEGTLAIFTEATLRTIPWPEGRALVLLGFESLDQALRAATPALATGPAACELLDRRLLSLARGGHAGDIAALIDSAVEAVLLVEYETDSPEEAKRLALELAGRASHGAHSARQVVPALGDEGQERLWRLREVALPSLYGIKGGAQPTPFIEDVGVPVEALPEFLARVQEIFKESEVTGSFLVHAGTGQVHARPFLDLQRQEDVAKLSPLAEKVHTLALTLGGTISSQHGTGLARTPWVARQFGPLYPLLRQVKSIFDPRGIFNPGKIVDPDASAPVWPLRGAAAVEPEPRALRWQALEVAMESNHCNGCGQCRSETPGGRMCPIFRATHDEAAAPRAKANLLRHLLLTPTDTLSIASDEVRAVADLCVNCKMCAFECPARVNIPKLMLEAKAANVAKHGLDRGRWFFSRLQDAARWGSKIPLFMNLLLQSRLSRWLFGRLFGLATRRRLPRFARHTFLAQAARAGWTKKPENGKPQVALFVDLYANHFDPSVAEAATRVLQHHGFDVVVPADQTSSGLEALAQGDIETTRELAALNLRAFAELARQGTPIVCLEPSAALMLRQDYLEFLDDVDARAVAAQTVEFTAFLHGLDQAGAFRADLQPLVGAIGYHIPCHMKALHGPLAGPRLLGKIPGLRIHTLDVSCSGMAGTFGLEQKNYGASLTAGQPMLDELRRLDGATGAAECSSCRIQMEDGAGKRALHPAQYLAIAYGLMPELAGRLKRPFRSLVL